MKLKEIDNQIGLTPIILISFSVLIVIILIMVGAFIAKPTQKNLPASTEIQTFTSKDSKIASGCKDRDYGGCDEGEEYSSWKDDGKP